MITNLTNKYKFIDHTLGMASVSNWPRSARGRRIPDVTPVDQLPNSTPELDKDAKTASTSTSDYSIHTVFDSVTATPSTRSAASSPPQAPVTPEAPVTQVATNNETSSVSSHNETSSVDSNNSGNSGYDGDTSRKGSLSPLNQDQEKHISPIPEKEKDISISERLDSAQGPSNYNEVKSKDVYTNLNTSLEHTTNLPETSNSKRKFVSSEDDTNLEPSPKRLKAEETLAPSASGSSNNEFPDLGLNTQPESSSAQNVLCENTNLSPIKPSDSRSFDLSNDGSDSGSESGSFSGSIADFFSNLF